VASPEVDNQPAVFHHGAGGAEFLALVKVPPEFISDTAKALVSPTPNAHEIST
jgi:hypothetical protein